MSLADGLGQRLTGRLARGRAAAEARMLSRVTFRRLTGAQTTDVDGYKVPEWAAVAVDVRCRLRARSGAGPSRTVRTPGGEVEVATRELHLPVAAVLLRDGDLGEITSGEHAGTIWQVVEAAGADQTTALRLPVVAAERPREW